MKKTLSTEAAARPPQAGFHPNVAKSLQLRPHSATLAAGDDCR